MTQTAGISPGSGTGSSRRELLRAAGFSLMGGLSLPQLLQVAVASPAELRGRAPSVILLNLFGGPPHQDMFDLKPDAPDTVRGEFRPISTSLPGVQICELLPKTARLMDRASLIRTYSHRYNSHNPYNVLTGFDLGNDAQNYFAKRTDHPGIGAVCQYFGMRSSEIPPYVILPAFPGYTQALRRAGPYGGYIGSRYDPLFTMCEPTFARESKADYDCVEATGVPFPPLLEAIPEITPERLESRQALLEQVGHRLTLPGSGPAVRRADEFRRKAFALLTSPKTRDAFDLSLESEALRDEYGRNLRGSGVLIARRLVEAGSRFVNVHWEAKGAINGTCTRTTSGSSECCCRSSIG